MDLTKQRAFNAKMGKAKHYPRHQNLSKGGMVDRKHFADGGTTQAGNLSGDVSGGLQHGGLFGDLTQQNKYQAQLAPTTQYNYAPTIGTASNAALNSQTVNGAIGAEQGLANQYGDIAAGRGPNPALAALAQQTNQNVANTAALQAGQRGGAANVGLLARQIGQQGANTQQNAVGQAATLQANQQLAALGAQGALQNQIANQGLGEQGIGSNVYATGIGGNNAQNAANISNYGQAQGLNQATAQANTQGAAQTQGGIIGGIGSLLQGPFGGGGGQGGGGGGGILGGLGALIGLNKGGEVTPHLDAGGYVPTGQPSLLSQPVQLPGAPIQPLAGPTLGITPLPGAEVQAAPAPSLGADLSMPNPENSTIATGGIKEDAEPKSEVAKSLEGKDADPTGFKTLGGALGGSAIASMFARGGKVHPGPHKSHVANYLFAEGGMTGGGVKALVSPQEVYLNPRQVNEVVERGADPIRIGHHFPGRDSVKKNSEKNDVIPVELEDGGVVLPISVTTHKDASNKGRAFVEKAHAKRYMKKPKGI